MSPLSPTTAQKSQSVDQKVSILIDAPAVQRTIIEVAANGAVSARERQKRVRLLEL